MASQFFNKPQLGQAQLSNSQQSNLPDSDARAQQKAQQAAKSIDMLSGLGQKVNSTISGVYMKNIDEKNKLQSKTQRPKFLDHVEKQISSTPHFESLNNEALEEKYKEYSDSFLEDHKDAPYANQLKSDMEQMGGHMLGNMIQQRGAMHTKIVGDATSQSASDAMQMYMDKQSDLDGLNDTLIDLHLSATEGFQDPASSTLPLNEDNRHNYKANVTSKLSLDSIMSGIMPHTVKPNDSRAAELIDSKGFREMFNISPNNKEYNKYVKKAYDNGIRADKINYDNGIDGFKEELYGKTNKGFFVDIDQELKTFADSGQHITEQDEHKLRKAFKVENKVIIDSDSYVENLSREKGAYDTTLNMTKKNREDTWDRAFTDTIGSTGDNMSVETVNAQLSDKNSLSRLHDYFAKGGGMSPKIGRMFEMPAGTNSINNPKWLVANSALMLMSEAAKETGVSITSAIGADRVGKIRAIANIQSNPILSDEAKEQQQLTILDDYSKINSRGYIKPMEGSTVNKERLIEASRDANWTTDDLEGAHQNAELMLHYAYQNERVGMGGEDAEELAEQQFNDGHSQHENPDGTEIAIPVEHKNLNPTGLIMFAKGHPDIANRVRKQSITNFTEYRTNRQIGMKKTPDFNVTKEYELTFDGEPVRSARFKYEDYSEYINTLPLKFQREVNKDLNKSRQETIKGASEKRERRAKAKGHGETIQFSNGQFDFEFNN